MLKDKIQYVVALIAEFAAYYHLTDVQALRYLQQYNALELCDKHYSVMHTLSFRDNIESLTAYCKRMGGQLG